MPERWEPRKFRWGLRQGILFIAICLVMVIVAAICLFNSIDVVWWF